MIIYCDGGCKGNGTENPESYGSYKIDDGTPVLTKFPTLTTNNQAEYQSLITALGTQAVMSHTNEKITIKIDSALVYHQVLGQWKVKNYLLKPFHKQAQELYLRSNAKLELISGDEMKLVLGH